MSDNFNDVFEGNTESGLPATMPMMSYDGGKKPVSRKKFKQLEQRVDDLERTLREIVWHLQTATHTQQPQFQPNWGKLLMSSTPALISLAGVMLKTRDRK